MVKPYSILLVIILFSIVVNAQTTLLNIVNPSGNDAFYETRFDPNDGSTVAVGTVARVSTGDDVYLVKFNPAHQIVWQLTIANAGNDAFTDVKVCSNGDYVVVGWMVQAGKPRGIVCRINSSNGNIIWTRTSTSSASVNGDNYFRVIETTSNNLAIVGVTDFTAPFTNSFILLLNSSGTQLWSFQSDFTTSSDGFYAIAQLPNGNLIASGIYNKGGSYGLNIFEINQVNGSVIAQNNYAVNEIIPGFGVVNSLHPTNILIRNGVVVICAVAYTGYGSNYFPFYFVYNQTNRNLSGYYAYHPGVLSGTIARCFPISDVDFLIINSNATSSTYLSRVTNGTIVYDRKIDNQISDLYSIDTRNNTDLVLGGYIRNSGDANAYEVTSNINFPTSVSCNITDANTLVLIPINLVPTLGTFLLIPNNPNTIVTPTVSDPGYTINILCTCSLISISSQPADVTICMGGNTSFSITAANNITYQWQESTNAGGTWNNVSNAGPYSGATTAMLTITGVTAGMNNYQYRCVLTSSCNNSTSTAAILFVATSLTPTVSITASANPICQGATGVFSANITNGGSAPVYQWFKNSVNVGTNSATYTDNALANGDVISCVLTSIANCVTGNPANSNSITITITATVSPSVTIVASPNTICVGTPATFTATSVNGGPAPAYQWTKNSVNVGTNSSTYTDNSLVNGDVIRCTLTSNANCVTGSSVNSNSITMVVSTSLTPSVTIVASASSICAGTPVTFTATPVNGGSAPVYQWTKNSVNVGTNSAIYTNNALVNGDVIMCMLTSNVSCATGNSANSNTITMAVTATVTASIVIIASATSICTSMPVTFTATPVNGGSPPVYQWTKNGLNVGTNSFTYADNTLANGDAVSCTLTSNTNCVIGNPANSNSITMLVSNPVTPSVSISTQSNPVCAGASVIFTATPTSGGASPVYQWKKNNVNVGTNSPTYSDNNIANGDIITCELISNAACVTASTVTSNSITMSVIASQIPNTRYPTVTAYLNHPLQLQARNLGANSYAWQPAIGLSNSSIINPVFNYNQETEYTISISLPGGCNIIDTLMVKVESNFKDIIVPGAFSPNGDNLNDMLYPILFGISKLNYFIVYNRWGNRVFETKIPGSSYGWNGEYKGRKQASGTYIWVVEGVAYDGQVIKRCGSSILIR
ncbi:MAG: gliding motility-associated C-terminal domain-containing protein [Ferruginibacter sp.]